MQQQWKLIILEWLDGSWKDTQADLLVERYWYVKTRLPFYTNLSWQKIKEAIDNKKENVTEKQFQELMTLNYIEHLYEFILPAINSWVDVVMTRFTPSMIGYGCANGMDISYLRKQASAIYRLLGREGIAANAAMPDLHRPIMTTIGYHIRAGKHDVTDYDWEQYLYFADKHWRR